jgi:UDP-N-acetylglucosamine 2-epimerase (non-hydrolysing)
MDDPLRLLVISTSRSDFGLLAPVVRCARRDRRFAVELAICGVHLQEGTPAAAELAALGGGVRLPRPADSLGLVHQQALAGLLSERRSEVALVLGDRVELLEAALACVHARVVLAHCSGGDRTFGAWDDQVRDAITKLAHLHFPAHAQAGRRLEALAEEPWRICVSGLPSLDDLAGGVVPPAASLAPLIGAVPGAADALVAVHPVTRHPAEAAALCASIAEIAGGFPGRLFLSLPNGDPGSEDISAAWRQLSARLPRHLVLANHGAAVFRAVLRACGMMIGNSSAGLIEAPSLGTPSIDAGRRQAGRLRGGSVVSCPEVSVAALRAAMAEAASPARRAAASPAANPYGDGHACPRILGHLSGNARRPGILIKA